MRYQLNKTSVSPEVRQGGTKGAGGKQSTLTSVQLTVWPGDLFGDKYSSHLSARTQLLPGQRKGHTNST